MASVATESLTRMGGTLGNLLKSGRGKINWSAASKGASVAAKEAEEIQGSLFDTSIYNSSRPSYSYTKLNRSADGTIPLKGGSKTYTANPLKDAPTVERDNSSQQLGFDFGTKDNEWNFMDLFNKSDKAPGIMGGALTGAGIAVAGSMIYGGARAISPNNAEVNNPIRNMVKGAFVGGVAAAAMMASHNATLGNFTKAATASDNLFMKKAMQWAPGVKDAMNSPVAKGAIFAGLVAGSGQFDLTRPVNPVY